MFDVHSLIAGKKKLINPPAEIGKYYTLWKSLCESYGGENFDFDSFCAGYIVGNNVILRERMLQINHENKRLNGEYDNPNYN